MPDNTEASQALVEKLAAVETQLASEVFVPNFIESFNKRAAELGVAPLTTADQAVKAIQMSQWLEAELANQKQASASGGTNHPVLDALFGKFAAAKAVPAVSDNLRGAYAELVGLVTG